MKYSALSAALFAGTLTCTTAQAQLALSPETIKSIAVAMAAGITVAGLPSATLLVSGAPPAATLVAAGDAPATTVDIHSLARILARAPGTAPSGGSVFAPTDVSSTSLDALPAAITAGIIQADGSAPATTVDIHSLARILARAPSGAPALAAGGFTIPLTSGGVDHGVAASELAVAPEAGIRTPAGAEDPGPALVAIASMLGLTAPSSSEGAIPSADFTKALGAISLGMLPPASDPMAPPSADLIASMKLMLDASATLAGMGAVSVPTVAVGMTAADAMRQERFFRDAIDATRPPSAVGEFTGNFSGSASFGGPNSFATGGTLTISGDFAQAANMTGQATITSGGAGSLALSGFSASQGTFSNVNSLSQGATLTDGTNAANVTSMNLQGAHTATTATGNWNMGLSSPGSATGSFNVAK